ncbi:acetyl-CoA carboxylase biotin carboxylase subunit [Salinispira pacifica]|nr:acetyl-CoA carboxylase biotin carboxylase subunit [Salinispira pacifica]
MIKSILIANRGEIAVRVVRACKEMGITSIVVYSEADAHSLPVRLADKAVCIGPPPSSSSYLKMENLISAAVLSGADAVHPGVGFLSENANFAREVEKAGLIWIGPHPDTIARMGDKVQAKLTAKQYGVPVIPGLEGSVEDPEAAKKAADEMGYPVIIKAASGGGGKGMRIVRDPEDFIGTLRIASSEAQASFNDGTVYLEKYLENPRHVEIQILGDSHGNVVHLGERDCSCQENHQKLVEESPSTVVTPEMRKNMGEDAVRLFKGLEYCGAGTIEFLVTEGAYYFMEVNARVQVEHPVTEMVTGVDIIMEQIRVASGLELGIRQENVRLDGYAVECRVNAKAPGKISDYLPPGGYGVRVESFLYNGYSVSPFYDSMVAKVICYAQTRDEGLDRMNRVLDELILVGIPTNIDIQKKIINSKIFRSGEYGTDVLTHILAEED